MSKQHKKLVRGLFRKTTFERDGYKCAKCGYKPAPDKMDEELDPHHITDRNEIVNGGYVIENGITLCKECHWKAEQFHLTGKAIEGYSPDDLYKVIGSSKEKAIAAASRTKNVSEVS